jgi:two-component system response regulator HydG
VKGIDDAALARLSAYHWPGNVRELENVIEQSLVFAEGDKLTASSLPMFLKGESVARAERAAEVGDRALPEILDDLERELILKAFEKAKGVKTETARLLGVKTSALYYKLEKYGIT